MVPREKYTSVDGFANKSCSYAKLLCAHINFLGERKDRVQVLWYSSAGRVCKNCCPDDSWRSIKEGADVAGGEVWSGGCNLQQVHNPRLKPTGCCWCIYCLAVGSKGGEGGGEIFWWRVLGASLCKGALTPLSRRSTSNCRLTSELSLALPSPQNTTSKLKTTKEMWWKSGS